MVTPGSMAGFIRKLLLGCGTSWEMDSALDDDERRELGHDAREVGAFAYPHDLRRVLVGLAGLFAQRVASFVAHDHAAAPQLRDQIAAARLAHRLAAAHAASRAVAGRAESAPHRA